MGTVVSLAASPVARYIAIGLVVLAFISYQRHDAARDAKIAAEAACQVQAQETAQAERERLERAIEETLAEAERLRLASKEEIADLREQTDALLAEIDEQNGSCPIPDDILDRLRNVN